MSTDIDADSGEWLSVGTHTDKVYLEVEYFNRDLGGYDTLLISMTKDEALKLVSALSSHAMTL